MPRLPVLGDDADVPRHERPLRVRPQRLDTALDGSAPLLLYGYGAYGMSMPASFSVSVLSLVAGGGGGCRGPQTG